MPVNRVILLIIDACGVGELEDAAAYGDTGAATLPHIARAVGGLNLPHCADLGLGNIAAIKGVPPATVPAACFGKMAEKSAGKDSTTGHWEIGGHILNQPFPLFPNGFPPELITAFENAGGVKTIGNIPASGTEIINSLGQKHLETAQLILYTSADSVFQLAAHEDIYPLQRLYDICRIARDLLKGQFAVARVIARPFIGKPGAFTRTSGRKDFSLEPPSDTVLDALLKTGYKTVAIGKVFDLFARRGFTSHIKAAGNAEVMASLIEQTNNDRTHQLLFANCVDFDMLWGHRNDEIGFARGLEEFDTSLGQLLHSLRPDDLLIITADHGCDPTLKHSTDHTREYVPLLVYGKNTKSGIDLGRRDTFADIAATIADLFDLPQRFPGTSFLNEIME